MKRVSGVALCLTFGLLVLLVSECEPYESEDIDAAPVWIRVVGSIFSLGGLAFAVASGIYVGIHGSEKGPGYGWLLGGCSCLVVFFVFSLIVHLLIWLLFGIHGWFAWLGSH